MKRFGFMKLGLLAIAMLLVLAGCGGKSASNTGSSPSPDAGGDGGGKALKAAYFVNGTLGDKGFFDSAEAGSKKAMQELGYDIKTVEGGTNQADWSAGLESLVSGGKYDVILVGTSQMTDILKDVATRYPKQKFIFFDDSIKDAPNIYSMTFSQSQGSFLAGAFAALVTESKDLKQANPDKVIGFVGGMDIPIINDFKSGYEQGAHYIDPDVKIVASYIGDFVNAPKSKELALAQYNTQNADVIFQVAGGGGLGVLEASKDVNKYAIGVDSNQNTLYPGNVLSSMLKNVDAGVYRAFDLFKQGKLPFGSSEVLGLKEGGVGLAKDDLYAKYVPQAIQDKMKEIEAKLSSGEIQVKSSL